MKVKELMTDNPVCFTASTPLKDVAQAMLDNDCGAIPIVESKATKRLVGIITDRDIVCRAVALGMNPLELTVKDCMSVPVATVGPDASLEGCCEIMERRQVRRIPVIDSAGCCCGMVSQADIAQRAPDYSTAHLIRCVSQVQDPAQQAV